MLLYALSKGDQALGARGTRATNVASLEGWFKSSGSRRPPHLFDTNRSPVFGITPLGVRMMGEFLSPYGRIHEGVPFVAN